MSDRDAFDGEIERLFARPPAFGDDAVFIERVGRRLNRNWRLRATVLTAAGVVGGFVAVREMLDIGVGGALARITETTVSATEAAQSLSFLEVLSRLETGGLDMVSTPAMPLFWLVSLAVIAAAFYAGLRANSA